VNTGRLGGSSGRKAEQGWRDTRKSGGPSAALEVNEDGRELSKDRVSRKVMAVKDNYVVIRMGVAN